MLLVKNLDTPDEKRRTRRHAMVGFGGVTFGRAILRPELHCSEDIKPTVRTDACQVNHVTSSRQAGSGCAWTTVANSNWVLGTRTWWAPGTMPGWSATSHA